MSLRTLIGRRTLLNGVTSATDSSKLELVKAQYAFLAKVAGTGAVAADVLLYVSNQDVSDVSNVTDWALAATISLSGTTSDIDSVVLDAPWPWAYVRAQNLSGTGAAVTVTMSEAA